MPRQAKKSLAELLDIMAALRTPSTGCPWDLAQSFATIAPYTIEEAYEVVDAIERRDLAALREELGDLLLQVVYHARMAEEAGAFAFADVVDAIAQKMLRRHPHVFGSTAERAAGAAPGFWERLKDAEKAQESKAAAGVLADVPVGLPALTRAVKLQQKAASVGFDWPSRREVLDKFKEEFDELEAALAAPSATPGARRPWPRRWATSCSSWPTWRVTSSLSPRRCCGRPTPSSPAGLRASSVNGQRPAKPRSSPTSPKWIGSGRR